MKKIPTLNITSAKWVQAASKKKNVAAILGLPEADDTRRITLEDGTPIDVYLYQAGQSDGLVVRS